MNGKAAAGCATVRTDFVRGAEHATGRPPAGGRSVSRQVSWLTGQCGCPAFPGQTPVALMDRRSPLTVAGAAPASHRLPSSLHAIAATGRTSTADISPGRRSAVKLYISISLYKKQRPRIARAPREPTARHSRRAIPPSAPFAVLWLLSEAFFRHSTSSQRANDPESPLRGRARRAVPPRSGPDGHAGDHDDVAFPHPRPAGVQLILLADAADSGYRRAFAICCSDSRSTLLAPIRRLLLKSPGRAADPWAGLLAQQGAERPLLAAWQALVVAL